MILLLSLLQASAGLDESAYQRTIDLIDALYLYPERVDTSAMLRGAATSLADRLHWLRVSADGSAVVLSHGDGTPIGSVSVGTIDTLPGALRALEGLVRSSNYDLDGLDVRLVALEGVTDALDPYSRVLSGERLNSFDRRLSGTAVGVGLQVSVIDDVLVIVGVQADSPASEAGIAYGDRILKIDGRATVNMPASEAERRILGDDGTSVTLETNRSGTINVATLKRQSLVLPNVEFKVLEGKVGYVRITHMSQRTQENLRSALQDLDAQGALARGLVIDLRDNTGGSMKESARVVDDFVRSGMLIRTAGPDGKPVRNLEERMDADAATAIPDVPIAILVDERTASGAEILAGALVELERAVLIGHRTYGKGTVQKIYPIGDDARLKLTVARYLLAHDRAIAEGGIEPDLSIDPVQLDAFGMHAPSDRQGLPWIQEDYGWREQSPKRIDLVEEAARRAVLATTSGKRADLLAQLAVVRSTLAIGQTAHLAGALAAKNIDWTVGITAPVPPPVNVQLRVVSDPERPDLLVIRGTLANRSKSTTLHRTTLEISSPFRALDGLTIPLGRLGPGLSQSGEVRVPLRVGLTAQEADVRVEVHAAGLPSFGTTNTAIAIAERPTPRVVAKVHLEGTGPRRKAVVLLENRSSMPIVGPEVHFDWPGDTDVDLIDQAARQPLVAPGTTVRFELEVAVGPKAVSPLPLRLEVESPGLGRIDQWPLALPLNGKSVTLSSPMIRAGKAPLRHPSTTLDYPLVVSDDGPLDHVIVTLNGEKVAWAAGEGASTLELSPTLTLSPGANRIVVIARDMQGLTHREQFVVRGLPHDAVVTP